MLTQKQFDAMKYLYETHGQTFTFDLAEARQFCWRMKLTEETTSIVLDRQESKFFIENDPAPMVRSFELQVKIHEAA